ETSINRDGVEIKENFDIVVLSIGRKPATAGLNLKNIGVTVDEKGFINVDKGMKTSIENVFAAGDVIATPMLAHTGYAEGEVAALNAFGEAYKAIDYSNVPNVVYSEIKTASVGLKEKELIAKNIPYKKSKQFFKSNGRAHAEGATEGFVKVLIDESGKKFLGASIVGVQADEMIHEFVVAKQAGVEPGIFENIIHAHPTFSELSQDAVKAAFGRSLHA
ncbi:MAG: NAD(P)/FAD-dependent oxidoreductase, partial [Candidatus Omnitrophica bacterium]|nr:NAD(P)/FAD-dependent oxidoreductase [Candidatus Omnitrophota bacterium]